MTNLARLRLLTAVLGVLVLTAAACGSSSQPTAAEQPTATPVEQPEPEPTEAPEPSPEPEPTEVRAEPDPTPDGDSVELTTDLCPTEGEEWEVAKIYIEHNATDEDTGVHGLLGGMAWRALCIWDSAGNRIMTVEPGAALADLAVSDFFFESREPPADVFSVDDLRTAFPEGDYTVSGTDFEGTPRVGTAIFTHDIPVEPEITAPTLAEDPEDIGDAIVPDGDLIVRWEPVVETLAGDVPEVSGYEVIVTMEEFDDPNGLSRPVYDVHVGPDVTELLVPDAWLLPETIYELEVLALEISGNQTISVGFFETE